ncbi:MAG: PIG-L family deacetylase [Acidobacteria bacterium]|nr:PIG-L family deacetylase [Acidobacteriota bacterium]
MRWLILLFLVSCASAPRQRVLWIGAHPDDEIFAAPLLYDLCVTGNASCRWIVLTRGERGSCHDPAGCGDLVATRIDEVRRSAAMLHATVEQWALDDSSASDPQTVLRRWNAPIARLRAELEQADVILTFDPEHGTTMHPDHRAAALLVAPATNRRIYTIRNRARIERDGAEIVFEPSPPASPNALVSKPSSWFVVRKVAEVHRSQFDARAIARLPAEGTVVASQR